MQEQKFDTKIKNADRIKPAITNPSDIFEEERVDLSQIKRHEVAHHMRERLQEGMNTKISSENKGF